MSKILIDEALVRQALEDFIVIKYGLEKSRIWGGMDWTYNPIHPVHYLPLRDKAEARMESLRKALAEAALDKMAENARELGLSYEQTAPAQEPAADALIRQYVNALVANNPDGAAIATKAMVDYAYTTPPAPAPDPDELTIAYMSGVYDGKKRKPLTDEQIEEIAARTLFPVNFARAIEAAHGIKENT